MTHYALLLLLVSTLCAESTVEAEIISRELKTIDSDKAFMVQVYTYALAKQLDVNEKFAAILRIDQMQRRMSSLRDFADDFMNEGKLTPDERREYIKAIQAYGILTKEVLYRIRTDIVACRDEGRLSRFQDPTVAYVDDQYRYATPNELVNMSKMLKITTGHIDNGEFPEAARALTWDWENVVSRRKKAEFTGDILVDHEVAISQSPIVYREMFRALEELSKTGVLFDGVHFIIKNQEGGKIWNKFGFQRGANGSVIFDWLQFDRNRKLLSEYMKDNGISTTQIIGRIVQRDFGNE